RIEVAEESGFHSPRLLFDGTRADVPGPGDEPFQVSLAGQKGRYVRVTATRLWKRLNDHCFALAELEVDSGGKNRARGGVVTALDSIEAGLWGKRHLVDGFHSRRGLPDLRLRP